MIADLVEIPHELGAFAEKPADGDVDFAEGSKDFLDLLGSDQGGQVEHDTDAQTGSHVGGARGQVSQGLREGVGELALKNIVEFVHPFPCRLQVEAAVHHLQAQVVLFVDHDAEAFFGVEDHRPSSLRFAQLMADQLPLHQELPIEVSEFGDIDVLGFGAEGERIDRLANGGRDGGTVLRRALADEGEVREIPGQPDSATHDDIGLGTIAPHPFPGLLGKFFKLHDVLETLGLKGVADRWVSLGNRRPEAVPPLLDRPIPLVRLRRFGLAICQRLRTAPFRSLPSSPP